MEDDLFDEEEEFSQENPDAAEMAADGKRSGTLQKSMTAVFVLAMIFLAALALEARTSFFSFYADRGYISAGFINIDKAYFYDVLLVCVFPFWIQMIFKGLEEEQFCYKSVASACMQVAALTIMQFLLFMEKSNI